MRILITGGAGFIGSHLLRELQAAGHSAYVLDREPVDLFGRDVDHYMDLLEPVNGPTSHRLDVAIDQCEPEVVVHLAAQVGRQFGEDAPAVAALDNVGMTALVARTCAESGVRLVYASTSEVYGDLGDGVAHEGAGAWLSVDDPIGPIVPPGGAVAKLGGATETAWAPKGALYVDLPHNVYGLTKRQAEEVAALYTTRHGTTRSVSGLAGLQVIRPSMPYGPGLPPGRGRAAIVNFLWQAHYGAPLTVHRGSERSWCWIGDAVRGIRLVVEHGEVAYSYSDWRSGMGCYNVGRDDAALSMESVAELALGIAAPGSVLCVDTVQLVDPPSRQTLVKRLSTAKLRALGWEPTVDLEEGMGLTYRWLLDHDWQGAGRP